jgi:hypothetical protein
MEGRPMKNLTNQLHDFIAGAPDPQRRRDLTVAEERLFRSMKTQGERATKGREVSRAVFEVKTKSGVSFLMIMEGRHSMSVGSQVARRFEGSGGVEDVEVVKTKKGACVILRPKAMVDA